MPKKMTIEDLAMMIQRGFNDVYEKITSIETRMATKEDLKVFATKEDLSDLEERLERRFTKIEDDLRIIKTALQRHGILSERL